MRITSWLSALLLIAVAACGSGTGTTADTAVSATDAAMTTLPPATTAPSDATTIAPPSTTTTAPAETTTTVVDATSTTGPLPAWATAVYGLSPTVSLGPTAALGSGCSPGTDALPDGMWFGWLTSVAEGAVEFDLACLWPGRLEPAASNDAVRIRTVPLAASAVFHEAGGGAIENAPGLPDDAGWWLFVNEGQATELAEYPESIRWARSTRAWPQRLGPGCCDQGDVAPPSPPDPWPETGWPVDGFYSLTVGESAWEYHDDSGRHPAAVDSYELTIRRWLDCDDHADLCPDWWADDEVTTDPEAPALARTLVLDDGVTVVIMPIFAGDPIVGDGAAFADLIADIGAAAEQWIHTTDVDWEALTERARDPAFPFGTTTFGGEETGLLSYRGPAGSSLTWDSWWFSLEIRDGRPILYVHAGLIAG